MRKPLYPGLDISDGMEVPGCLSIPVLCKCIF